MRAAIVIAAVVGSAGIAHAYPQYQLSRDVTCTSCHISPAGGGLLNENGYTVAEATASHGGAPAFMYDKWKMPASLDLGGDVRLAAGGVDAGAASGAAYPMQAEVYGSLHHAGFSLELTGGARRPQDGGSAAHVVWSREHYAMWRQHPDAPFGLYVRAGRFMPVFGLRLAEHSVYTQRYGGLPLYGETYGGAVEYVQHAFEIHATGFVRDPIASAVEHGDGGALYAEARLGEHAAVGAETKYEKGDDQTSTYGGLTGKVYLTGPDVLLQAEAEYVHHAIAAGGTQNQMIAYLLGSRTLADGWLLDVGLGHYTQDLDVSGLYRDCVEVNVHWFTTSHVELLVNTRLERLAEGPAGGYALAQLHYRL